MAVEDKGQDWVDYPITFKCNMNCLNCILNMQKEKRTVNFEEVKKKIDELEGANTFGITGGEPTIAPYFFKVLRYARSKYKDLLLFVVSNGRMFYYEGFIKKLNSIEDLEPFRIAIALYGHTSRLHNKITQTKNSFKQTVEGIKNLLENGYEVELRIIVNKLNYKDSLKIAKFIEKNFKDLFRVVFIHMKYTGNAYKNRDKIGVRITEANPYVIKAVDYLEEKGIDVRLFHFPLCTIPKRHWEKAKGVTKQRVELGFVEACEECDKKEVCPRIWKTYKAIYGEKEFKAIKD